LTGAKRSIKRPENKGENAPYDLRRLPRPCRRSRFANLPDQLGVFEPLADDADYASQEPARVRILALVEPERLLVEVTEQVKRLNAHIGCFRRIRTMLATFYVVNLQHARQLRTHPVQRVSTDESTLEPTPSQTFYTEELTPVWGVFSAVFAVS
jgi:hypothetical protein